MTTQARSALVALAVAGVCCGFAASGASAAARSGVTIQVRSATNLHGFVFSPNSRGCADRRLVKVFRQVGRHRNRNRDINIASDRAGEVERGPNAGKFRWLARVTVRHNRKYYARVAPSRKCEGDASKTVRADGRPDTKITDMDVRHRSGRVSFRYKAIGGFKPASFECRLDRTPVRRCDGGAKDYRNVSPGRHVFKVWAIGTTGLKDFTAAKREFRM